MTFHHLARMSRFLLFFAAPLSLLIAGIAQAQSDSTAGAGKSVWQGVYTEEQATRGDTEHQNNCSSCHGTEKYAGARALAETGTGLTYAAAREALAARDGPGAQPPDRDPRRYRSYVDGRRDTTAVLAAILDGETSAVRLLAALGVERSALS